MSAIYQGDDLCRKHSMCGDLEGSADTVSSLHFLESADFGKIDSLNRWET